MLIKETNSIFVKRLAANLLGRDFVVGDLHGSYRALTGALAYHAFDPKRDRLLCAGDLADRGMSPLDCLSLLRQPWFHCVKGNHEQLLIDWLVRGLDRPDVYEQSLELGGLWLYLLSASEREELDNQLVPLVRALPHLIVVDHPVMPFNLLHAEAVHGGRLQSDDELRQHHVLERFSFLWGRSLHEQHKAAETPVERMNLLDRSTTPWHRGLSLTYVGHQIVPRPLLHRSHLYIDCGAYLQAPADDFKINLLEHDAVVQELMPGLVG